ncbi:pyridoxal phosphate-dependent aminotransferase [Devosia nitrariae]|uniref:Histidinol-phosphate aminotransferase n=1 Tax=Devosia nitrariae TaxID=2071872 RepID=A0ABQ5W489_9HYPH|nr:pyridoxal phosphate-dependent aminotransferase [Devosia nitrariae]GLQ54614.1 histidinol-phosphate aminotransferase [Devosia nitrariae]
MTRPPLARLAAALPEAVPFVGPEAIERRLGKPFRARLGANESGFGPSPRVLAVMAAASHESWKYGDPENHDLRVALADHLGVAADEVMPGEGIDALLGLAARLYIEPGEPVVTSAGGYPTFDFHVAGFGGRQVKVPYEADRENLAGLAEAVRREKARLVYLANPDNPMGTWWTAAEITAFIDALPSDTMLILDEAYGEFAPAGTLPPIHPLRPNVLRMRTFSKAHGMAGVRVGYVVGVREAIAPFNRIRNHFGISRMGQAGAIAALADEAWLADVVARTAAARQRVYAIAAANGFEAIPSATNFVAIDCGRDGAYALGVLEGLVARGVFVRKPASQGLDRCIRVSVGPDEALDIFEAELPAAIAAAQALTAQRA